MASVAASFIARAISDAQSQTLRTGDRVRVTAPPTRGAPATAAIMVVDAEGLRLNVKEEPSPLVVPWSSMTSLAVSEPRSRREGVLHGLKWGLAIGTALGVLSVLGPPLEDEELSESQLALAAVFDGALIGAVVGALRPGRRWRNLNVAQARDASLLAASAGVTPAPTAAAERTRSVLARHGMTPAVEVTAGVSAPKSEYAQFPGLALSLALNAGWRPTQGVALVGDAHMASFRSGLMGGPRLYLRSAPLYSESRVMTYFGQLLVGTMRKEVSGVVRSNGGFAVQPGVGVDYGGGAVAGRVQIDYAVVRDGFVRDDRIVERPVEKLTGWRVLIGTTLRSASR